MFFTTSYFVKCIYNYGSAVDYDIANSKIMYKYFLKTFYNRTNKKKYNLQI